VSRKLSVGGATTWSVEAADAEARRLRNHGANACNSLLALLGRITTTALEEAAAARCRDTSSRCTRRYVKPLAYPLTDPLQSDILPVRSGRV